MWTVKIVETYSHNASPPSHDASPPHDAPPPPHGELVPSSGTTQTGLHARRRYRQFREQSAFLPVPIRREGTGTLHEQPIENCHSQMMASMADQ